MPDFPPEWALSEIHRFSGARKKERPAFDGTGVNRFYGDIWLLEQIAQESGNRKDLELVFDGNKELVDDILTLAMFPERSIRKKGPPPEANDRNGFIL